MAQNPASGVSMGQLTELRHRLLFVLGAIIVYRIGTFIPVPGVDPAALAALFDQQKGTILDMFNMFSGGALSAPVCLRWVSCLISLPRSSYS